MDVKVLPSVDRDTVIWRYMSLDKYVSLVGGGGLFFSCLSLYKDSDPYEGIPPACLIKMLYEAAGNAPYLEAEKLLEELERQFPGKQMPKHVLEKVEEVKRRIEEKPARFVEFFRALVKGMLVNCWHANPRESEAMWKLYGDSGKGIAIKSTVGRLERTLQRAAPLSADRTVFIGRVKYLDYDDAELTPKDCFVDGHIAPLTKRISYRHEDEVRAFFSAEVSPHNIEDFSPKPFTVDVDVKELIEDVYISPYVGNAFSNAVEIVTKEFLPGVNARNSRLLHGVDEFFDSIVSEAKLVF